MTEFLIILIGVSVIVCVFVAAGIVHLTTPANTKHLMVYRVIDWDKVKTKDDIILVLKAHPSFTDLKTATTEEWKHLDHLLSDEIYVQHYD